MPHLLQLQQSVRAAVSGLTLIMICAITLQVSVAMGLLFPE